LTEYQHLEEEQQTIAQLRKTSFIQSGKEHVGTETLFITVNQAIVGNENVTSIAQNFKKF
jgi:hypothetical protein